MRCRSADPGATAVHCDSFDSSESLQFCRKHAPMMRPLLAGARSTNCRTGGERAGRNKDLASSKVVATIFVVLEHGDTRRMKSFPETLFLRRALKEEGDLIEMGEPQVVSEQMSKRVESDVEQRIFPTQSGRRDRAECPGTGTLPDLVQGLDRAAAQNRSPTIESEARLRVEWPDRSSCLSISSPISGSVAVDGRQPTPGLNAKLSSRVCKNKE